MFPPPLSSPPPLSFRAEGLTQGSTEDRIATLRSALLDPTATSMMRHAGVTAVSCILVQPGDAPGKAPLRNCFHWTQERDTFDEWPLLRHVEPPLSDLLELVRGGGRGGGVLGVRMPKVARSHAISCFVGGVQFIRLA